MLENSHRTGCGFLNIQFAKGVFIIQKRFPFCNKKNRPFIVKGRKFSTFAIPPVTLYGHSNADTCSHNGGCRHFLLTW